MNDAPEEIQLDLVRRYGQAVAHMRQLTNKRALGLALGSGVSQSAGFPRMEHPARATHSSANEAWRGGRRSI
jgi:hypothetical protein